MSTGFRAIACLWSIGIFLLGAITMGFLERSGFFAHVTSGESGYPEAILLGIGKARGLITDAEYGIGTVMPLIDESRVFSRQWIRCDGARISKNDYRALYDIMLNSFEGIDEDSESFRLPDYRGMRISRILTGKKAGTLVLMNVSLLASSIGDHEIDWIVRALP